MSCRLVARSLVWSCALALTLPSSTALAEPSAAEKATADALFTEARKLANEGRFVEACPKFAQSQRLDPGVGTLLYLGECYEKTARIASAWGAFRDAADLARATNQAPREKVATSRASALEPRLPRILIELSAGASAQNIEVKNNGEPIVKALLGAAFPLDSGMHTITVTAPGKKPWSASVELTEGATAKLRIPPLEDAAVAPPVATTSAPAATSAPPAATSSAPPAPTTTAVDTSSLGTRRTVALVAGGVGVVGIGLGSYFGLRALSQWDDVKNSPNCDLASNRCGTEGSASAELANKNATRSTVLFAVGAVALGGGAALWFWPSSGGQSTALRVGPGAFSIQRTW